jgi:hypothetical protein
MSHHSRHERSRPARRNQRKLHLETQRLEERCLLAPIVSRNTLTATLINQVTVTVDTITTITGDIDITETPSPNSAAGFTSVGLLTSLGAFGGDMVRIEAGPGGDFGKGVYAISRGAGANADPNFRDSSLPVPINRPGVIYRVDPATGKASVFFDLNTVLAQTDPGAPPGNGALPSTGLVNWYDLAFDPEGVFDGRPSLFVTSISSSDAAKNVVYRIGSDGSFLGLFIRFTASPTTGLLNIQPTAALVPPVEQQGFLRGLFVGDASSDGPDGSTALFFDANLFRPGQEVTGSNPAAGINSTGFTLGPQVGITAANTIYASPEYSAFTDFGLPPSPITPPQPGFSGVQGVQGESLINLGLLPAGGTQFITGNYFTEDVDAALPDTATIIQTPFRRFQDIAFDQYGYFSNGALITPGGAGQPNTIAPIPPTYAGSVFVTDLAIGLSMNVAAGDRNIFVPIMGEGFFSVTFDTSTTPNTILSITQVEANEGGRVIRIGPDGVVTPFAENFHTTISKEAQSFLDSTLSITFSADGTTVYVADMDGIWQFKTVTSLAGSTSGSIVGLNDLRTLGVPYQGQDLAVAVVDTGVDANNPYFRGRVAPGKNVFTNGLGNDDTAGIPQGHGTEMAGVIAQFVPQATIVPVNVFTPNTGSAAPVTGGTTSDLVWAGLKYVAQNPFVNDPVRPNTIDRVVAANFGFGTATTFATEGVAYRFFPQVALALKGQFTKIRKIGIAPIAAAGQFGAEQGETPTTTNGTFDGVSMPAVFNEVISVGGTFSFPFSTGPTAPPTDQPTGVLPRPLGPILVTDNTGAIIGANLVTLTAGDLVIFTDRLLQASNRSVTTDYVAPALDIPTFVRTSTATTTTVGGTGLLVYQEGGTSLSSAMVAGSFAVVASALSYWTNIANSGGVTADAYLNMPVGTRVLNFGPHEIANLSAYQNPDAVNSILQWTAVPARDQPSVLDTVAQTQLFPNAGGPYPNYSRIDVGNAIASIEGTIALNYLIRNGYLDVIDTNHNGLITAQEIQTFTDNANTAGIPEAGAMARLLGGTARITNLGFQFTAGGESPDQPDVLQRRYNYFDYAADGQLDGVISVEEMKMLAKTLMPAPDAFVIVDRQRSSGNGYLLSPEKDRSYVALQYLKPSWAWIPKRAAQRFGNLSPRRFGVGRGDLPGVATPLFTLFGPRQDAKAKKVARKEKVEAPKTESKPTTTPPQTETPAQSQGQNEVPKSHGETAVDTFLAKLSAALKGQKS